MNEFTTLAARLTKLERSARRWKLAFAALALCVVGVAADAAVKDATFGTVKASRFEVVAPSGQAVGAFSWAKREGTDSERAFIVLFEASTKSGTFIYPGEPVKSVKGIGE